MKRRLIVLAIGFIVVLVTAANYSYAQIDSRNQTRPDREQAAANPDKKKKKDKRQRDKNRRLRGKKDKRLTGKKGSGLSGKKIYSNKKQIRQNSRKTGRAKQVDRGFKGDITGRKQTKQRDSRREDTRTYYQPDPYEYRRIRTEKSRAGPDAPKVRSATKKGEKARTGDISGQRTVRQKSKRSAPIAAYPQPNPYKGRTIKTEKQRAKSNKKQIRSVRSATRPSESRPPRARTKTRAGSISATARPKVRQKKNVYRDHERTGGEKSTTKDIAGRKLRTRNTRSAIESSPVPYSSINPYTKGKRYGEGERYRRTGRRYSSARSISRSSESAANRGSSSRYGQHRNRRTIKTTGVFAAKRVRSTSDPRRSGERRIYGSKYSPPPTRSVSRSGESKGPKKPRGYISVSGRRKTYRQRNTYQGKDRHFGENSTTRDIAGKKLRTRNKRSFHPTWDEFGGGTYGTGSVGGKPTKKYASAGGRRKARANWNNSGVPIIGRGPGPKGESSYTGRMPLSAMPSYGPSRASTYTGRMPLSAVPGFGQSRSSTYRGNMNARKLRRYRGGNESLYAGNRKARKRIQGGGSISAFWNNKGTPIPGRGPGPTGESGYTGRMPLSALPGYGPGKSSTYSGNMPLRGGYGPGKSSTYQGNMSLRGGYGPGKSSTYTGKMPLRGGYGPGKSSTYAGNMPLRGGYGPGKGSTYQGKRKAGKPRKGGGSITGGWNNSGNPIAGRGPSQQGESSFTGRMPLSAMPGYGPTKASTYQGKRKGYKPLKGGGSITGFWNNDGRALRKRDRSAIDIASSGYKGNMPLSAMPSYGTGKEGTYTGTMKARKPLTGGGGSITKGWNNNEQPIQGKGPGKYDVGSFKGSLPLSAIPSYGDPKIGVYQGAMKAKKPIKGAGGSITTQWNNNNQPIQGKGPGKYDVGRYTGNLPLCALPGYGDGKEGSYQGNLKRKDSKPGQSQGTERGRTKSLTFLRLGDPNHMGLNHREKHLQVKNDLPKELSRAERQRISDSEGLRRGRTQSLSFFSLGDPTRGGLHAELGNKKRKNDLPREIRGKNRLRLPDSEGMDRGRTRSFAFLKLGDPEHGGLHAQSGNFKRKRDLPREIKGKNRLRIADADGLDNGRSRTFSFWAIGNPTRGGLVRTPAQARGRLHPSADYTKPGHYYNSIEKKEQPVKVKLWFAQLFKKNANQPDAVKEKERRPRYNKNEREIWETSVRDDWYKN